MTNLEKPQPPTFETLSKYGLTAEEWVVLSKGGVCDICGRKVFRMVVDHKHVLGWKRMAPEQRRKYVRGVICTMCNHYILTKYGNVDRHIGAAMYLAFYEGKFKTYRKLDALRKWYWSNER